MLDFMSKIAKVKGIQRLCESAYSLLELCWRKLPSGSTSKINSRFFNKLKIVEEETDESQYFLELILEIIKIEKVNLEPLILQKLIKEADELLAIVVSSIKTARNNQKK